MERSVPSHSADRLSDHCNQHPVTHRLKLLGLALCLCAVAVAATVGMHAAFAASLAGASTYTGAWTQPAATADIPTADESTAVSTYESQYGFFAPHAGSIASDEMVHLAVLVPYARVAA